jgi:hypothetical protein
MSPPIDSLLTPNDFAVSKAPVPIAEFRPVAVRFPAPIIALAKSA